MDPIPPAVFLEAYPPSIAAIGRRLRDAVLEAFPDAVERVRPGWRLIGFDAPIGRRTAYFAWIMPEREHIHLGFVHGALMADPERSLDGAGITKQARWVTFEPGRRGRRRRARAVDPRCRAGWPRSPRGERAIALMAAADPD